MYSCTSANSDAATRMGASSPRYADHSGFITQNAQVRRLLAQADRVAESPATVLLTGESGTGKEVLARRLHGRSPRRRASFVRLNCASLPEGVLESELFGHEKGAFTGAIRQRLGRFELANRGTLFLDEIGAADIRVQLRLLRVLQEREFERVGGAETLQVDVRVIAATNVDLREEVRKGTFREDLFYRLNVVPLKLPPLRQRKGGHSAVDRILYPPVGGAKRLQNSRPRRRGLKPPVGLSMAGQCAAIRKRARAHGPPLERQLAAGRRRARRDRPLEG